MKKLSKAGLAFFSTSITCLLGIILACINDPSIHFNFKACGITIAIVFGIFALFALCVYLGESGS